MAWNIELLKFLLQFIDRGNKVLLGIAIDGSNNAELPHAEVALLKKVGKVSVLEEYINGRF